tara:strand:+ start:288 stop:740 length:453 start_codon:yes stop_codon:yes gene_type:complete
MIKTLEMKFKAEKVARLAAHSSECKRHFPTFANLFDGKCYPDGEVVYAANGLPDVSKMDDTKTPVGFILMLDNGAQLLSNGLPAMLVDAVTNEYQCVYAEGFERDGLRGNAMIRSVFTEEADRAIFVPIHWFSESKEDGDYLTLSIPFSK